LGHEIEPGSQLEAKSGALPRGRLVSSSGGDFMVRPTDCREDIQDTKIEDNSHRLIPTSVGNSCMLKRVMA